MTVCICYKQLVIISLNLSIAAFENNIEREAVLVLFFCNSRRPRIKRYPSFINNVSTKAFENNLPGYLFVAVGHGRKIKIVPDLYFWRAVTHAHQPSTLPKKQTNKKHRSRNHNSAPFGPSNAPVNVSPPTPGNYGTLAIKQNQTVIMPHIKGPLSLSNPLPNVNNSPTLRPNQVNLQIKLPTESACAMLAQLVRSLTANQKVPGSIPCLVEGWALGDLLSPHRLWTGTLNHWSRLSMFYRVLKRTHALVDKAG